MRHDECDQPRPRDDGSHLLEELFAPRGFLFAGVFGLGKTQLPIHGA
jgi:hypothetical protein